MRDRFAPGVGPREERRFLRPFRALSPCVFVAALSLIAAACGQQPPPSGSADSGGETAGGATGGTTGETTAQAPFRPWRGLCRYSGRERPVEPVKSNSRAERVYFRVGMGTCRLGATI